MVRTVLHSDCNSFYASVECMKQPQLKQVPLAVGGDEEKRHGIILAKNELAKAFGVRTAEPLWQARLKCPGLVIVPPDFEEYERISKITRAIYSDFTDRVEPFGLDEAWLDVTGDDGAEVARKISRRIKSEVGITVSVGVSFNKIFAKLGSDYRKPDAITVISPDNFRDIVWPLSVTAMIGVGRATGDRLAAMGIKALGQLANAPDERVRLLGKTGVLLKMHAGGRDSSPVRRCDERERVKSVGNSVTLPHDIVNAEEAARVLLMLSDSVGRRLREQKLCGQCVSVGMRDSELCRFSRQRALGEPTNRTADIRCAAIGLVANNYRWQKPMRSIGVTVTQLSADVGAEQVSLFVDVQKRIRSERLERVADELNRRFGSTCIRPAAGIA